MERKKKKTSKKTPKTTIIWHPNTLEKQKEREKAHKAAHHMEEETGEGGSYVWHHDTSEIQEKTSELDKILKRRMEERKEMDRQKVEESNRQIKEYRELLDNWREKQLEMHNRYMAQNQSSNKPQTTLPFSFANSPPTPQSQPFTSVPQSTPNVYSYARPQQQQQQQTMPYFSPTPSQNVAQYPAPNLHAYVHPPNTFQNIPQMSNVPSGDYAQSMTTPMPSLQQLQMMQLKEQQLQQQQRQQQRQQQYQHQQQEPPSPVKVQNTRPFVPSPHLVYAKNVVKGSTSDNREEEKKEKEEKEGGELVTTTTSSSPPPLLAPSFGPFNPIIPKKPDDGDVEMIDPNRPYYKDLDKLGSDFSRLQELTDTINMVDIMKKNIIPGILRAWRGVLDKRGDFTQDQKIASIRKLSIFLTKLIFKPQYILIIDSEQNKSLEKIKIRLNKEDEVRIDIYRSMLRAIYLKNNTITIDDKISDSNNSNQFIERILRPINPINYGSLLYTGGYDSDDDNNNNESENEHSEEDEIYDSMDDNSDHEDSEDEEENENLNLLEQWITPPRITPHYLQ